MTHAFGYWYITTEHPATAIDGFVLVDEPATLQKHQNESFAFFSDELKAA